MGIIASFSRKTLRQISDQVSEDSAESPEELRAEVEAGRVQLGYSATTPRVVDSLLAGRNNHPWRMFIAHRHFERHLCLGACQKWQPLGFPGSPLMSPASISQRMLGQNRKPCVGGHPPNRRTAQYGFRGRLRRTGELPFT